MSTYLKSWSQLVIACFCFAVGLLAACGGSTLDQGSSIAATAAALSSSQMAESQVQVGVQGGNVSGLNVNASGGQFTASGTLQNPAGGSLSIDAHGTYGTDGSFNYTAMLTYNNWKDAAQNIVLNGTLADQFSATVSGGMTTVQATYTGDLVLTGAVNGTVTYDLSIKQSGGSGNSCLIETGQVGGFTVNVKAGC